MSTRFFRIHPPLQVLNAEMRRGTETQPAAAGRPGLDGALRRKASGFSRSQTPPGLRDRDRDRDRDQDQDRDPTTPRSAEEEEEEQGRRQKRESLRRSPAPRWAPREDPNWAANQPRRGRGSWDRPEWAIGPPHRPPRRKETLPRRGEALAALPVLSHSRSDGAGRQDGQAG